MGRGSDRDDLDEIVEGLEVVRVACVQRKLSGVRGRCNQQVNGAGATRRSSGGDHRGVDAAVGSGCVGVERERLEGCFRSLQSVSKA